MNSKRVLIRGTIALFSFVGIAFLVSSIQTKKIEEARPKVYVSTFALYEAANNVANGAMEIHSIVPLGSDPHMFSPNPTQVANISNAELFVYNGAGFEVWAKSLTNTLPKTTKVIDMSQYVQLHQSDKHEEHSHENGEHHDEHEHHHGTHDPHYWLDIDNMIKMTQTLEADFSKLLPQKAPQFHQNSTAYIIELKKLQSEYVTQLAQCKKRTIITNHDAFGYLARSNNLKNISVIGLSSDEQPSAQTVAHVIKEIKEHGIKTIFFEEMVNDNVSQTIAKETGAKAVSLQPLENITQDELNAHQTYLFIMRENLTKLKIALECR
jgi:zinc transport system substrate-binding protein